MMNDFAFRRGTAVVVGKGDPAAAAIACGLARRGSAVSLVEAPEPRPARSPSGTPVRAAGALAGGAPAPDREVHTCVLVLRLRPHPVAEFADLVAGVLPRLRRTQGSVVVVTSADHAARRYAELDGLVRELAAAERAHGVRINHVAVGELLDDRPSSALPSTPALTGTVEDIAEAVCFLVSDRAGFISGQRLAVNGGADQGTRADR
jgi:3-oxoacyl-[acyl-carrier protein] reductase